MKNNYIGVFSPLKALVSAFILLSTGPLAPVVSPAQTTIGFTYDDSGNRDSRAVVASKSSALPAPTPAVSVQNLTGDSVQTHTTVNHLPFDPGYFDAPDNRDQLSELAGLLIFGDIVYEPAIDPGNYSINTSLAVGKTPGNLDVWGSAGYHIPIEIPKGINGLQPAISLDYTSDFTDGFLGMGWDLGGISTIQRVNKTIYNDTRSDPVRGISADEFIMDGKRLLPIGGNDYRTEIEEFSRVVKNGYTGTGPEWFKVYTKSGLIYEYGNTEDSKVRRDDGCILVWKVNKITDRYNNYITFYYHTTDNLHPVERIEYTGNSSLSSLPYAQVIFNYKNRSDVTSYYYGGQKFTRNILLDNIKIENNGQTFKKYQLTYMLDGYSQLLKVTEYSGQNEALNPTVFVWTHQTDQFSQTTNYSSSIDELYYV